MYDVHSVRKDFPVVESLIYLDNAATTQTPLPAVDAMIEYFTSYAGNHGRGAHRLARQTTDHYEDARETVAHFLNVEEDHTIFTKNATESINMVSHGMKWTEGDHVITTLVEHHSNLLPWLRLREQGVEITVIKPDNEGNIESRQFEDVIQDRTRLLAINHVSNVFGSERDIKRITRMAHNSGALALVDGSQSAGHMPVDVKDIGCDFFVTPGHKGLLGPQGTGVLCVSDPELIEPTYIGGGAVHTVTATGFELEPSPGRFEAGTPNIPGVIGLGRAVEYVQAIGVSDIDAHEKELARDAARRLSDIDGVQVYGPEKRTSVVPFNVEGMDPHDVAMILDETKGICVRSGYHCAMPGITHMGLEGTVRASFALYNTADEVTMLVDSVAQVASLLM